MNFDPQNLFIGLMDFFSILLPGALLTYLLMGDVGPAVLGDRYANLAGAQAWAAFLFASYLFGHMAFLLGSWLDEFYDWARRYTLNTQITLLARRGRLLPWLARAQIWLVFKGERNLAVDRAGKIKRQALGALQAKDAINTFQPSKARLNAESPASLGVVQRFEADSKFFRCFTVVLMQGSPWRGCIRHICLARAQLQMLALEFTVTLEEDMEPWLPGTQTHRRTLNPSATKSSRQCTTLRPHYQVAISGSRLIPM